jgi:DNA-binding CsgD family transcriptional regulator
MSTEIYFDSTLRFSSKLSERDLIKNPGDALRCLFRELVNVFKSEIIFCFPELRVEREVGRSSKPFQIEPYLAIIDREETEIENTEILEALKNYLAPLIHESRARLIAAQNQNVNSYLSQIKLVVTDARLEFGVLVLDDFGFILFHNNQSLELEDTFPFLITLRNILLLKFESLTRPMEPTEGEYGVMANLDVNLGLSLRQLDIVNELTKLRTIESAARSMGYSVSLLKKELALIYPKLGVKSKGELLRKLQDQEFF